MSYSREASDPDCKREHDANFGAFGFHRDGSLTATELDALFT